jgi:hypothetical protein
MLHPPLSESLRQILESPPPSGGITLNFILERTEKRGLFLIMILLSLPFLTPIPMPGMSNFLGFVMMWMALRLALQLPAELPKRFGNKPWPAEKFAKVLKAGVRFLMLLEKFVRPRGTGWMTWRISQMANASLLALMAFVLMLPIPPIIPFSNSLPSYSIIVLSASMMEEDGLMIWVGYAVSAGTLLYIGSATKLIIDFFVKYWDHFIQWMPG